MTFESYSLKEQDLILDGVRVIDWTLWQMGPYASAMLADLGAEVIHVEEPMTGDSSRGVKQFLGVPAEVRGRHIHFEEHNRNKKSITIDLRNEKGREILYRLVEKSDIFVTNYRANAAARFGADYSTLSRYNPRLIYASASCLGPQGPERDAPGLELIGFARSGLMMGSGEEGMPPIFPTVGVGDRTGAVFLAYGMLAALIARDRLGIGQELHISQLGTLMVLQGCTVTSVLWRGEDYPRFNRTKTHNPLYNYYRCKDDRWIVFGLMQSDRYWPAFCQGLGMPELEKDPRFDSEAGRAQNREALIALLDQVFQTKPCEDWEKSFKQAGDLLFSRVNRIGDLESDPQVLANDYIVDWNHPVVGPVKFLGFPVQFSKTPMTLRTPAPELGEHTEEVLMRVAGYTWDDIDELRGHGVI